MRRSDARDELARLILGSDPAFTSGQVAAEVGIGIEDARRLWRALGFPDAGDSMAFVHADLVALSTVKAAVAADSLDLDTVLRLTRALGITMSRLADWQVSTLAEQLERRVDDEGRQTRLEVALDMSRTVGPAFEGLLVYAWRRHLAASVGRTEALGANDDDLLHARLTVGFADLVAFTALSNGLDDTRLADLVEDFETRCIDIVTAGGGRAIKTLGDSVLFIAEVPDAAVEIGLRVIEEIGADSDLPDVRLGLGTGTVINRLGDVYGPPVNLAARLTAVARRNRMIVDHATAEKLGEDYETRTMEARPMRGFGNVVPVTVRRRWSYNG